MECVVVHDLFLNETANYAHVFLPGSTFLEKDGTFTNAERRIQRVRKVMAPRNGYRRLGNHAACSPRRMGFEMHYDHPSEIMDEIARLTPTFAGVSYDKLDELGSVQWPCNDEGAGRARRSCISNGFVRGKGKFIVTEYVRDRRAHRAALPAAADHRPHPVSQYNVGAQTRRTDNVVWHAEDRLEIHPHDAEQRGVRDGDWVKLASRAGDTTLRALITERVAPGVVYTTFHHPDTQANVDHDRLFGLGDELPRIQGDGGADHAVERAQRVAGAIRRAGRQRAAVSRPPSRPRSNRWFCPSPVSRVRPGGAKA